MGLPTGQYSKNIFNPMKRYWGFLSQESTLAAPKSWVDADFNDWTRNNIENVKRFRYEVFGDGTPGTDHWECAQGTGVTANNFSIQGGLGVVETAARFYLGGMTAVKPGIQEFDPSQAAIIADEMDYIHHKSTGLSALVLTDLDANYVVDELNGRDVVPDVTAPATRFAITSNTATTITIGAGNMLALASAGDHYCVALSTPGGLRVDSVYLDVYLDEWDATEDADLLHSVIGGPPGGVESCRRLKLVQQIHIYEGGVYGATSYPSVAGNTHYRIRLAAFNRLAGNANVLTAMIDDERPYTPGYGSSQEVIDARVSTVYANTYLSLDARLEVVEDDALDAHNFIDTARSDGTYTGGVCTDAGGGTINYTGWTGSVDGEDLTVVGGAIALAAFVGAVRYVYVTNAGLVTSAAAAPATGAILCRTEVTGGGLIANLRDWRYWINALDEKNQIVVAQGAAPNEGNVADIQTAIDYALIRRYSSILVRADAAPYTPAATITIADYGAVAVITAEMLDITFEPGAVIQPTGDFSALTITNSERIAIHGLEVLGTNLANVTPMVAIASSTDIIFTDTVMNGAASAGDGFSLSACTRLRIDGLFIENVEKTGIEHTAGTTTEFHLDHANIEAVVDAITLGAGVVRNSSLRNMTLSGFTGVGLEIVAACNNITVDHLTATGETCAAVIDSDGDNVHISGVDITSCSCTTGGVSFGTSAGYSSLADSYLYDTTTGPAVRLKNAGNITIKDSYIDQNNAAEYPISIDTSSAVTVRNVKVIDAAAAGIYLDASDYCTITGCNVEDSLRYGIYAQDSQYLKVVDCTLVDVLQGGGNSTYIHIQGCSWSIVAQNHITHTIAGVAYGVQTIDNGAVANVDGNISDNTIYLGAGDFGIYLGGAGAVDEGFTVSGNTIYFTALGAVGIFLNNLMESVIANNIVNTATAGISVLGGTLDGAIDVTIRGNVVKDGTVGINLGGTVQQRLRVDGNIIDDPTVYGISGSILAGPLSVTNNTIDDAGTHGIYFSGAGEKIHIANNYVAGSGTDGIRLDGNDECSIIGNGINTSGGNGIHLNACDRSHVSANRITDSTVDGIDVNGGANHNVSGNFLWSNTGEGINLAGCTTTSVTGNACHDNNNGVLATATTHCAISGNTCNDNTVDGIHYDGTDGSITGNVCYNNGTYGIYLIVGADDNAVSGNNAESNGDANFDFRNAGANNGLGVAVGTSCDVNNKTPPTRISG